MSKTGCIIKWFSHIYMEMSPQLNFKDVCELSYDDHWNGNKNVFWYVLKFKQNFISDHDSFTP